MATLRVVFLWHMHQPFYKDLVSGEYRLPWVRLHALKDYYGMVKMLEEFPGVHATFNLVPSLVAQIEEYASGGARDPFLDVAAKPAADLTEAERRFALEYLFQANPSHMIGRYPRYRQLWEQFRSTGEDAARALRGFSNQDLTDLQVLSQIAWVDEFFLEEPEMAELARKGREYTVEEQAQVIARQKEYLGRVLPAYREAAARGQVELSTSPFYHPILPLLCDTDVGAVSSPGLPLPRERFRHPEDAVEQLRRAVAFHESRFGGKPRGAWPSEGSVSDEVMVLGCRAGLEWMATDEGVLGRSLGRGFHRDGGGRLVDGGAEQLYTVYRYEKGDARMHMLFRDHTLSDRIGFVYSGVPSAVAAAEFIHRIKEGAQPILNAGRDAVVSVILDGENAWEYYPRSGREFLRRLYAGLAGDSALETVTVSEAIERHREFGHLGSLVPGSWIHANFNVWIGAPEDNRAWDYLSDARNFYEQSAAGADEELRQQAQEEVMIAEGSDWNWWYGPQHHSANDRDFDELYRKHLSNIYHLLGGTPPEYLAQPIVRPESRPRFVAQSSYIHPRIDGNAFAYFDWLGAACLTTDQRGSAMHGKQFLLETVHAGIDDQNLYGRVDFIKGVPRGSVELVVKLECLAAGGSEPVRKLQAEIGVEDRQITAWRLIREDDRSSAGDAGEAESSRFNCRLRKVLEFELPLAALAAERGSKLRLRCSIWRDHLPVDALPAEGWMELDVVSEEELAARS